MPNLDSYLERFENYQKEQEELNEILIRTIEVQSLWMYSI